MHFLLFDDPKLAILYFVVLILSLSVHEFAHAWSAWKLGDDTAARMGRMTLNPVPHIDVFGTILLPLFNAPIGWAKPVPVNPARFRRGISMSTGDIIVSAAGPVSNLLFGLISAVILGLLLRFAPGTVDDGSPAFVFLNRMMLVNAGLAIFNILPVPPLDGSHVAANLMPYRYRGAWDQFARMAPFLLVTLVLFGGAVIRPPLRLVFGLLWRVTAGIAV